MNPFQESVALAATRYSITFPIQLYFTLLDKFPLSLSNSTFLDKRGVRGRQPPAFPFLKKMLFDGAFVNISSFCNLFFLFYREENRELGAIFCLLLLLLLFVTELEKY